MIDRKLNDPMDNARGLACADYADRLVDLSDGELAASDRAAVEAHLADCGPCRHALRRLDASLAALRTAVADAPPLDVRSRRPFARAAAWIAAGSTAAAILLAIGVVALKAPTSGRGDLSATAGVEKAGQQRDVPRPGTATTGRGFAGATTGRGYAAGITPEEAFRRIALLEQQARLETSLALMPNEPWLADQRAANERLLAKFRQAAAAGVLTDTTNEPSSSKDTL